MTEHRLVDDIASVTNAVLLSAGTLVRAGSLDDVLGLYSASADSRAQRLVHATLGETVLQANGVGVAYDHGSVVAVRDVDLHVREGEIVGVVGNNGSGKSSLLRALAGLVDSTGSVSRKTGVAYVPQNPNLLLSARTVLDELRLTQKLRRIQKPAMFDLWLHALGLQDLRDRHPRSLSGGERQRVGIAAVAVSGAEVLLLDEPTRGIDPHSEQQLVLALHQHVGNGGACVIATHDRELLARIATRVVTLEHGRVVSEVTV